MYLTRRVHAGGDFDMHPRVIHAHVSGLESSRGGDVQGVIGQHVQIQGTRGGICALQLENARPDYVHLVKYQRAS
jgi:hypothetical protein